MDYTYKREILSELWKEYLKHLKLSIKKDRHQLFFFQSLQLDQRAAAAAVQVPLSSLQKNADRKVFWPEARRGPDPSVASSPTLLEIN